MQKSVLTLLTLSVMANAVPAHAELVPSQTLNATAGAETTDSLATRILDNDEQGSGSTLFKMSAPEATGAAKAAVTETKAKTENARNESRSKADQEDNGILSRLNAAASQAVRSFSQSGIASWYGRQFNGRKTASGATYDMYAMTAAHRTLPLNCFVRVTNKDNGKSVVVKVNDRGPYHGNRVMDLSFAAASKLGITQQGTGNVTIERISSPQ